MNLIQLQYALIYVGQNNQKNRKPFATKISLQCHPLFHKINPLMHKQEPLHNFCSYFKKNDASGDNSAKLFNEET